MLKNIIIKDSKNGLKDSSKLDYLEKALARQVVRSRAWIDQSFRTREECGFVKDQSVCAVLKKLKVRRDKKLRKKK